jgi:hypothetical protein
VSGHKRENAYDHVGMLAYHVLHALRRDPHVDAMAVHLAIRLHPKDYAMLLDDMPGHFAYADGPRTLKVWGVPVLADPHTDARLRLRAVPA